MGSEFFFAVFAKITLTPFNGPRNECVGILRKSALSETVATPWVRAPGVARQLLTFFCFAKRK